MMVVAIAGALVLLGSIQTTPVSSVARWTLQVEPASCVLQKQDPETGSILSISTTPGSDSYRIAITGDDTKASGSPESASLTFSPSQKVMSGLATMAKLPNKAFAITMQGLPPALLDDLSGTSIVTLAVERSVKRIIPVTGTIHAVVALRKCIADQLVEWGADPAQFASGGMAPTALQPRDEWISNHDFLRLAAESKRSVIDDDFRLVVAADGVITECHATAEMTEPGLEKTVCAALVSRRLFSPARNASGTAVLGAATFRVNLIRPPS